MAILEGGVSAAVAGVGAETGSPLHVLTKPDTVGALGQFTVSHRTVLVNSQAANSRIFTLRNTHSTNLIVVHSIRVEWIQTANHTAAILDSLDVFKLTGFTAHDTTNTETPTASKQRTSFGSPAGEARGLAVAGNSAGMTGGTLTKDSRALRQFGQLFAATAPTSPAIAQYTYAPNPASGEYPLVLAQNEGVLIENRVALGAAAGSAISLDILWAEVTAY